MTNPKKLRVEFAPGCFDEWDGTQAELDEFVRQITSMAESGELAEGMPVTEETLADMDPEDQERLLMILARETKRSLQ